MLRQGRDGAMVWRAGPCSSSGGPERFLEGALFPVGREAFRNAPCQSARLFAVKTIKGDLIGRSPLESVDYLRRLSFTRISLYLARS